MKDNKLVEIIPKHTIFYIVFSAIALGYETAMLQLKLSIGYSDFYYTIVGILISLGLLITSLVSLKDWNKFINDKFIKK